MFILASQSPRRKEILQEAGYTFEVISSNFDESTVWHENPSEYVMLLANKKAEEVFKKHPNAVVLAADTIVYKNNKVFGKPADESEAAEMLKTLSGETHQVFTGMSVISKKQTYITYTVSEVTFHTLDEETISWYIETKEPFDKAGAYGIQGAGSKLIKTFTGDYYTIMGLSLNGIKNQLDEALKKTTY